MMMMMLLFIFCTQKEENFFVSLLSKGDDVSVGFPVNASISSSSSTHDDEYQFCSEYWKFLCSNGRCISQKYYCDGLDSCGDNSDEISCSKCNKTLLAYQMSEVLFSPKFDASELANSTCQYTIKTKNNVDDVIVIHFSSFEIGKLEGIECKNGFFQIIDGVHHSTPAGKICGKQAYPMTFYSEFNEVTLIYIKSSKNFINQFSIRYSAIKRSDLDIRYSDDSKTIQTHMSKINGTYCNTVIQDCEWPTCKIQSPGYPGFYLPNLNCSYTITSSISHHQIKLMHYAKEFNVPSERCKEHEVCSSFGKTNKNCSGDYLTVYDGVNTLAPAIATFCGTGKFPTVKSSANSLHIQLLSSSVSTLKASNFYFISKIQKNKFSKSFINGTQSGNAFEFRITSLKHKRGLVKSMNHWYKANTSYRVLFSGGSKEILWLRFKQFHDQTLCKSCLFIFDSHDENSTDRKISHLCGSITPLQKGYLTTGSSAMLLFNTSVNSLSGREFSFRIIFEFINTWTYGIPVPKSVCNEDFNPNYRKKGLVSSPSNALFYGLSGNKKLRCVYTFTGIKKQRIFFNVKKVQLISSTTNHCDCRRAKRNKIVLREIFSNFSSKLLDCFCKNDFNDKKVYFTSGRKAKIVFDLQKIYANQGPDDFNFLMSYEFVDYECENEVMREKEGFINSPEYPKKFRSPINCLWHIKVGDEKFVFLQMKELVFEGSCEEDRLNIIFIDDQNKTFIHETLCKGKYVDKVFSRGWQESRYYPNSNEIFIELVSANPNGKVSIHYGEISKKYLIVDGVYKLTRDCEFLCSDKITCISKKLICSGHINCPASTKHSFVSDEHLLECNREGTNVAKLVLTIMAIIVFSLALFLLFLLYKSLKQRKSEKL